eukprot:scaffold16780_cov192-Skeletonema_marinoi.AAC.3
MAPPKKFAALEDDLKAAVNAEIAHRATEKEQGDKNKTAEEAWKEALGELLEMKKDGLLSYRNLVGGNIVELFKSSTAKDLWPEIKQKAEATHVPKNKTEWWAYRIMHALPQKARMSGSDSGKRKIGEVTGYISKCVEGSSSAIETVTNLEGLLVAFEADKLSPLMNAIVAIITGNEDFSSDQDEQQLPQYTSTIATKGQDA